MLRAEIELARRLYAIQTNDSRIGFEATNHYFFTPMDLAEKVLNAAICWIDGSLRSVSGWQICGKSRASWTALQGVARSRRRFRPASGWGYISRLVCHV